MRHLRLTTSRAGKNLKGERLKERNAALRNMGRASRELEEAIRFLLYGHFGRSYRYGVKAANRIDEALMSLDWIRASR